MSLKKHIFNYSLIKKIKLCISAAFICAATLLFCSCTAPQNSPSELMLKIDFDTDEEVGLLIIDWELGGERGSGGISNADKSMLSPGEPLDFSFGKSQFKNLEGLFNLTLNFTISTEYFEPNFENDYPEEYLIHLEPVSFKAEFGNSYDIEITGNKNDGYKATVKNVEFQSGSSLFESAKTDTVLTEQSNNESFKEPETPGDCFTINERGIITSFDEEKAGTTDIVIPEKIDGVTVRGIECIAELDSTGEYLIGDGVGIFSGSGITTIVLPETLTRIEAYTFCDCKELTYIKLPESLLFIGRGAFQSCGKLSSIEIPDSVTHIRNLAFAECENLSHVKLPKSLASLEARVFWLSGLESIEIPDSVTSIEFQALSCMRKISSIQIPNSVIAIDDMAFAFDDSLAEIKLSDNLISIGAEAFKDCKSLTSVVFPKSLQNMGEYVFCGCDNLKRAIFLGDAPRGEGDLDNLEDKEDKYTPKSLTHLPEDYVTLYVEKASGFTNPWRGYPARETSESEIIKNIYSGDNN